MKQQTDQQHNERSFDVGDWVLLQLQPYKKMSLKEAKKDNKLSPKYYGPYKALEKYWYYGIQIGAACIFPSTPKFSMFHA